MLSLQHLRLHLYLILRCDLDSEYVTEAGQVSVSGASGIDTYTCVRNELALTNACDFTVSGYNLSAADRLQALNVYSPTCGVDPASVSFVSNPASPISGNASQQYFQLGTPLLNGIFPVCYCAAYGGCDHFSEFTHRAGSLANRVGVQANV